MVASLNETNPKNQIFMDGSLNQAASENEYIYRVDVFLTEPFLKMDFLGAVQKLHGSPSC
jgi:hypothetical protein